MGERELGLQHAPSPSAGDRRGQQRCPERAGSHRPPSIALLEARQGELLILPWKPTGTGKGLPGVSRVHPNSLRPRWVMLGRVALLWGGGQGA